MSLLNDALRKRTGEVKEKKAGYFDQRTFAKRNVNERKISRIYGLPLILGCVVFGVWYFWGSLFAQTDTPIVVNSIPKDIEIVESDLLTDPNKEEREEVKNEFNTLKPIGEITSLEVQVKADTRKESNPPMTAEVQQKKLVPPPTKKVEKKARHVKKDLSQKSPNKKDKVFPTQQEALFFQKALRYHQQGKINEAIQMYQQVLRVKPNHQDALFNLASAYIQLSAYSEAFPLLKTLRSYDPGNPDVLVNLAIAEIGLGKATKAMELLDLAAKQYQQPKFEIYFHQAAALSRLGRLEEALRSYKTAEELNSKHATLNFNMAVLYDKLNQYAEAVNYYRAFMRHSDNLPQAEAKSIESRIRSLRAYLAGSRNS
jgi:Flp pilus assembly protein TadD